MTVVDEPANEPSLKAELAAMVEQRDALAAALLVVLRDLHPIHGSTAHHTGGYGASVMTTCCHIARSYGSDEALLVAGVEETLSTVMSEVHRRGSTGVADAITKLKAADL